MAKFFIFAFGIIHFLNKVQLEQVTNSQEADNQLETICRSKRQNCSQCIQTSNCKWCGDTDIEPEKRCFYKSIVSSCRKIEDGRSEQLPISVNKSHFQPISSVNPTKVHVRLRPGTPYKLNVSMTYKDLDKRPLDLYILMDLSCTMSSHKNRVAALAQNLADRLKILTTDLRMGFGSFVDKPVLPFAREKDTPTVNCDGVDIPYEKPHLFKNHLSLTSDIDKFTRTVRNAKILTNIDVPEGGLDALMQVISCKEELKWRYENNTRRLIVLASDGSFHVSGDGKLGGIILPNDGICHMDEKSEEYNKATVLDYPSVSQIRDKIQASNVFVIFAVTHQYKNLYTTLSHYIGPELTSVSVITDDDSSSITKVIEDEYKKVVRTVNLQQPIGNSKVGVTYYAKCPEQEEYQKQDGCTNLKPNSKVDYWLELELKSCPENSSLWSTNLVIQPSTYTSGNGNVNFLNITIDMACSCGCESNTKSQVNSDSKCNGKGFEQCGICKCEDKFGGPFCNCTVSGTESVDSEECLHLGKLCSDNGQCVCGKCTCNEGYVGNYCECSSSENCKMENEDNGRCNENSGQGVCSCRGCQCNLGFEGNRCHCPISNESCKKGNHTERVSVPVCNNFGSCECGKCTCDLEHHGEFCELEVAVDSNPYIGSNCKVSLKELVEPCVKCISSLHDDTTPIPTRLSKCQKHCGTENNPKIKPIVQEKLDQRRGKECDGKIMDDNKCDVNYVISGLNLETGEVHIRTEQSPSCPPPAPILYIIISVVGSILVIGVLTLFLWKILTHFHDKKEYEKFESEKANAIWSPNQNPLYKATVTEFQNPTYLTEIAEDEEEEEDGEKVEKGIQDDVKKKI